MADFVAVLRKAISNLGENTPEMREKVYDKARATIEAKLAAINPPPPASVADRQRKALEEAIAVVRADYAEKEATVEDDELEDIFASLHQAPDIAPRPPAAPQPAPRPAPAPVAAPQPRVEPAPAAPVEAPTPSAFAPEAPEPAADQDEPRPPITDGIDTLLDSAPSRDREPRERRVAAPVAARGSGKRIGLVAAIVVLLAAAAGAGYFFLSDDGSKVATETPAPEAQPAPEQPASTAEDLTEEEPQEQAAATPEQPATPAQPGTEKFTQRLLPDGSEVDEGPAGEKPSIGEGTSVATLQQPANAQPAQNGNGAAPGNTSEQQPAAQQQSGVAVGQRAIFYEERTSSAQGSAELGNIVWSIVQESPGGDLPPEPAIRAEATIPGKDVQLRMTIRRNGDATLPASHIVEMIFLTPEGFEGGAISNVSRMSFKETEQAAGSPLIGIPAKIADGFFLIALGDAPAEIQTNMNLLRQQSWIDIPIVYQTGRRALLSLEKGIPGDKVFQEALQAWEQANAG
jgi:hypothetical protein